MAVYVYEPGKSFRKASTKQIATRGLFPSSIPITVGTDGFIRPVIVNVDIEFSGSALVSARLDYFPEGQLVFDGASAPTSVLIEGQQLYTYPGIGTLNLDGSSPVTFNQANGTIEYVYVPIQSQPITFEGNTNDTEIVMNYVSIGEGISFDGESTTGITQNYLVDDGGIIFDGNAGAVFKKGEIGGRGVLRTPRMRQPVVYQYEPSLYRKDAWNLRFFKSVTAVEFVDGKKYKFISQLPKYAPPKDTRKNFIRSLPKTTPVVFDYISELPESVETKLTLNDSVYYYNHVDILIKQDDEFIEEMILGSNTPLVAVTFDKNINHIRKDDEYIVENFLL